VRAAGIHHDEPGSCRQDVLVAKLGRLQESDSGSVATRAK
jgi:hypothetical protein